MFKWKRGPSEASVADAADSASDAAIGCEDVDDSALEAFVRALRGMGQHAFDLEHESAVTFSQRCEAWARHLLLLTPPPGDSEGSGEADDGEIQAYVGQRDWPSALQFILSRQQRAQQHVNSALGELRQGIWAFAQSLGTALVEDQR